MSATDLKHRASEALQSLLRLVRRPPWLTTGVALAGAVTFIFLALRSMQELTGPAYRGLQVMFSKDPVSTLGKFYELIEKQWITGSLLLAPALLLALIRQRRGGLVLPLFLVCAWVFILWLARDLSVNWTRVQVDPLGMRPSVPAYFVKLGLIGFLMLSPPLLLWLYWRSTLLDRYVVRSFCTPLLLCISGISGIMITMDVLNNANEFVQHNFSLGQVILFYLYQLPQIIVTIAEAVLLLATLYALSRLARYNELVSMLGSGRSVLRIVTPILVIGGWSSLAVLALNYQLAPEAARTKEEMLERAEAEASGKNTRSKSLDAEPNVAYRNSEDRRTWLLHRIPYDLSDDNKMVDVCVIHDDEQGRLKTMWVARRAMWFPQLATWRFYDVTVFDRVKDRWVSKTNYEALYIHEQWRETPGSILSDKLNPDFLGVQDLVSYLNTNVGLPERSLARYRSTLHGRFATPFRCFLMVLIAAPLAMVSSRRGLLGGVAAALSIFVMVFFLSVSLQKLAEGGYVPPAQGAWSITVIFAFVGVWLLWMRSANREIPSLNPMKWRKKRA